MGWFSKLLCPFSHEDEKSTDPACNCYHRHLFQRSRALDPRLYYTSEEKVRQTKTGEPRGKWGERSRCGGGGRVLP